MAKAVSPPSRYWAVQKAERIVQRHETVADDLESLTFVIPESCDTEPMSKSEFSQVSKDTSILSNREKGVLGILNRSD
jgi:hypothetical protein